jgi:hypothetical protein
MCWFSERRAANSDAIKRCVRQFGNYLGNICYDKKYMAEAMKRPRTAPARAVPERVKFEAPVPAASAATASSVSTPVPATTAVPGTPGWKQTAAATPKPAPSSQSQQQQPHNQTPTTHTSTTSSSVFAATPIPAKASASAIASLPPLPHSAPTAGLAPNSAPRPGNYTPQQQVPLTPASVSAGAGNGSGPHATSVAPVVAAPALYGNRYPNPNPNPNLLSNLPPAPAPPMNSNLPPAPAPLHPNPSYTNAPIQNQNHNHVQNGTNPNSIQHQSRANIPPQPQYPHPVPPALHAPNEVVGVGMKRTFEAISDAGIGDDELANLDYWFALINPPQKNPFFSLFFFLIIFQILL